MVLVSYKLNNKVSILQTKLSNRERHEARHVGEEAMPLDQHIEGGHGEREAGVEIPQPRCMTFLKWHTTVSIDKTVATRMRSSHSPRRQSLRLAGSPSAAWKAVSLKMIMRPSNCCTSH